MKRIILLAVLALAVSTAAPAQTVPEIIAVTPDQNEVGVLATQDIQIRFSLSMRVSSLDNAIIVYGSITGYHTGNVTYFLMLNRATFNPDNDFAQGEVVTVSVTRAAVSMGGVPLAECSAYNFTVGGVGGTGAFSEAQYFIKHDSQPGYIRAAVFGGDPYVDLVTRMVYSSDGVTIWNNDGTGSFTGENYTLSDDMDFMGDICPVDIGGDFGMDLLMQFYNHSGSSSIVGVMINPSGDGGALSPLGRYTSGTNHGDILTADFDGDGDQDILDTYCYEYWGNIFSIRVYANSGSGSYSLAWEEEVSKYYYTACVADFNNDGNIDFATINDDDDYISVWLNDGSANFTLTGNYTSGYDPSKLYAADLDGDGAVDIVTVNFDTDNISMLFNNGLGVFGSSASYSVGDGPSSAALTDLDGDGDLDIATTNINSCSVSILLNDGTGNYGNLHTDYPVGTPNGTPGSIAAADYDGDGDIDLAVGAGGYYSNYMYILYNQVQPYILSTSPGQNELDVPGDTNISVTFDTDMDGATINASTFKVNTRTSEPLISGWFSYDEPTKTATFNPLHALHVGDLVTVTLTGGIMSAVGAHIYAHTWSFVTGAGDGTGSFVADMRWGTVNGPMAVCATSLWSNSALDVITANYGDNTVSVRLNNSTGYLLPATTYAAGNGPCEISADDFDADSDIDFVVANYLSNNVSVFMNNRNGSFAAQVVYPVGGAPNSVHSADLNADGYIDLATANVYSDNVSVLINNGDGTFAGHVVYPVGDGPSSVFASDLDGDGDLDLVTANEYSDNLSRILNNGDGTFTSPVNYAVGDAPCAICALDLDGDGDSDLAISNRGSDNVSVLLNTGNGSYSAHTEYAVGGWPMSIDFGDFDGDGDIDLVTADYFSDGISILLNTGNGTYSTESFGPFGDGTIDAFPLDLDMDGDLDLAVVSFISEDLRILMNQNPVEMTLPISVTGVDIPFVDGPDTVAVLNFASESLDSLTIIAYPSQFPPNFYIPRWVRRYYEIIPHPSDAIFVVDITLFYTQLEFNTSFLRDESLLHLFRYDEAEAAWEVQQGVVDVVSNCVTCTGVTEFSNWAFTRSEWIVDDELDELPAATALHQNYPNPFNPATQIMYVLHRDSDVKLAVYDVLGREIAVLVDSRQTAGHRTVAWNGTDSAGGQVASGVYFYQLVAGDFVQTRKMILLR